MAPDLWVEAASSVTVRHDNQLVSCSYDSPTALTEHEYFIVEHSCPEPIQGAAVEVSMPTALVPDVVGATDTVVEYTYPSSDFHEETGASGPRRTALIIPHADFGLEALP